MPRVNRTLVFLFLLLGCAEGPVPTSARVKESSAGKRLPVEKEEPRGDIEKKEEPQGRDEVQRKLIYNGQMTLVTSTFEKSKVQLAEIVEQYKGYVLQSDEQSTPGMPRRITQITRIPAAKSDEFRREIAKIAEVQTSRIDAEDVTDQYYDTKAELVNREAREVALRELYKSKQAGSKLSELLEIDREIDRVRSEINVRIGRIKRWDKLSEYATFTITLEERTSYTPAESPYFSTRLMRAFGDSVHLLYLAAQGLVLCFAAAVPWLLAAAVVIVPFYLLNRRSYRRPPPPLPPTASVPQKSAEIPADPQ